MPLTAVILAAGAGTRLGQLGQRWSKAMLPIGGQPLIGWVLRMLAQAGAQRFVVVGHPSDTALAQWTRTHDDTTLVLQSERRGIADALSCALPGLGGEEAYVACACDSLYRVIEVQRLIQTGRSAAGSAVVGVIEMGSAATATRSAVCIEADRVVDIVEKPAPGTVDSGHVALPLYWLPRAFDEYCGESARHGSERYVSTALRQYLLAGGVVRALSMSDRLEITTAADVEAAAHRLRDTAYWFDRA